MKLLIKKTAFYNNANGGYAPVKRFDLNQRINFKGMIVSGELCGHIAEYPELPTTLTRNERVERYEERCLSRGKRPSTYTDSEWSQFLRDYQDEEHTALCEAKQGWRYEY
jgi:ribosomal protein L17